jgi:hypothetical protein
VKLYKDVDAGRRDIYGINIQYTIINIQVQNEMKAASIHFCDFRKKELNENNNSFSIQSICGMLRREYRLDQIRAVTKTKDGIYDKRFSNNELHVTCPVCKRMIGLVQEKKERPQKAKKENTISSRVQNCISDFFKNYELFSLTDIRIGLQKTKCPYFSEVVAHLKSKNLIKECCVGTDNRGYKRAQLYEKQPYDLNINDEISNLIDTIKTARRNNKKRRQNAIGVFKAQVNVPDIPRVDERAKALDKACRVLTFHTYEDQELVDELRRRGFTVTATKTVIVEL